MLALVIALCFVATIVRSTFGFGVALSPCRCSPFIVPLDVTVPLSVRLSVLVAPI